MEKQTGETFKVRDFHVAHKGRSHVEGTEVIQSALSESRLTRFGCGRPTVDILPANISKTATSPTWERRVGVGILIFLPCSYYSAVQGNPQVLAR